MFPNFDLFKTDLHLAQESILILNKSYDFFLKNQNHPLFRKHDKFFDSNLWAHRISSIINLHKVYDKHPNVDSITNVMEWLYENKGEFSKIGLVARKGLAYANSMHFEGVSGEQFDRLFEIKRDLQKTYDKEVKS